MANELPANPGSDRARDAIAITVLICAVLAMYCPPQILGGNHLLASGDFSSLHQRRIEFARTALFGPDTHLPAWYPRELCGTPFWSNVQNFPFLPTRLILFVLVDPWYVHEFAVNVAAILAATFTYLYLRRLGVGRWGASVAGWTFVAAGFFASRVRVGHLPLLEAYPALPMLLWLAERWLASPDRRSLRRDTLIMAICAGIVMLAGHPQLPVYAVGVLLGYIPLRLIGRTGAVRATAFAWAAIACGVGCTSIVLWPMLQLIARSTRVLDLERAANDVALPYWRLKSYLLPWADGWPDSLTPDPDPAGSIFTRAPDETFYDSVCYIGVLPIIAVALLAMNVVRTRLLPTRPFLIIAGLGTLALLFALPWVGQVLPSGPWTILRSPARQTYITTLALAVAAGVAFDLLLRFRANKLMIAFLIALLVIHFIDLRHHANDYLQTMPYPAHDDAPAGIESIGDGRVAIDTTLVHPLSRRVDDVGVFDSVLLAKPYRALTALAGWPPRTNRQIFDGSELGVRALQWSATQSVLSVRDDLPSLLVEARGRGLIAYNVPNALPRAGFIVQAGARAMDEADIYNAMHNGATPSPNVVFLPPDAIDTTVTPTVQSSTAQVNYERSSSDDMTIAVNTNTPGFVRIIETWDPGWRATIDSNPTDILLADGFMMAIAVGPGSHEVRLKYSTPGLGAGIALSLICAGVLGLLVVLAPKLMPPVGIEPTRPFGQRILSP